MKDIKKFISGFRNFRNEYFCREDAPFELLCRGQSPTTMVIACSDSRTDPSFIMQCEPGEIFVVRNVANIVPPYERDAGYHGVSSAIEYAVKVLQISNLIVLGHSLCGGIDALMHDDKVRHTEFLYKWLSVMGPVREEVVDHFGEVNKKSCTACEMAGILQSLRNLLTFPWITERVEAGTLNLHGWYFDMESGQLLSYLRQTKTFEPLEIPTTYDE
ncbi:MAG: carbonic anhydrase [Pseudodesulfovibrio sp.]|uniref:Carbonic anhydrase n=1 Tax=Pseudodesulfovibrio indicus TaxID=1716143 RepID=A0A126QRY6_9BACT|nr:carbonic anhydrase [Pseudodesulfovibrio indicus]AMK12761.1 carbonic anhydrase [Pseudodesulfovibrio indicus]TDT86753.1 carbonic anhydrase [Pseudodesulfovibrio indicus]